ncbi:MAG: acetyl-CoA carboxylase, carboxyltransferase subunit beta, partial [Pseudonocardiaceae bacterium]
MTSTLNPIGAAAEQVSITPDWLTCTGCRTMIYRRRFHRGLGVCPACGWHAALSAVERLDQLLDTGSGQMLRPAPTVRDPLSFVDTRSYPERLRKARDATGLDDSVVVASGRIKQYPVVVAAMDFRFLGGSLGVAAGEAITTAAEAALTDGLPLLLVTASGGARMQEGPLSLMQMAKTSNAMAALDEAGLLTVTLVTDPTYGGVAASYATLSDVILAEPGARMGFAGPRVIEQTVREKLPPGFQTAEFLLEHGLIDDVRARTELRHTLGALLVSTVPTTSDWDCGETDPVVRTPDDVPQRPAEQVVLLARHLERPTTLDHVMNWVDSFVELRGDRLGADCPAMVGGLGTLEGLPVMIIGHQKGHDTATLIRRRFGMPSPAGYRKAARLMRMAAKLRIPIVTLIDTPGAYPGLSAEENGQALAIAECLRTMGALPVPVVSVITGEGGSGGALALAVADRVYCCANAIYSVISPEGCAAILWKQPQAVATAAAALHLDARSLLTLGIVDGVVPEPDGGAAHDP